MSIYVRDKDGKRKQIAGNGMPGKSAYQYAVDGGFTGTEEEFAALLGVKSNQNLLDNWYFADPINQRGQTEYTGRGYTIDRYNLSTSIREAKVQITDDGIVLVVPSNSTLDLYFVYTVPPELTKALRGRKVCLSFYVVSDTGFSPWITVNIDGRYFNTTINGAGIWTDVFTVPNDAQNFSINLNPRSSGSITLKAAKLELGSVQTLAHKDTNGNWVLNDPPPNKALELAKCQRYFCNLLAQDTTNYTVLGFALANTSTRAFVEVPIPCALRSNPTLITGGLFYLTRNQESFAVENIFLDNYRTGLITLAVDVGGNLTPGAVYILQKTENSSFLLDANL